MTCYRRKSDGSRKTTRAAHLSDGIKASISAVVERDYESQVAARLRRQEEELARLSMAQGAEKTRLDQLNLSLRTRAEELDNRERGLTSVEGTLTTVAGELGQQRTRQEQQEREISQKGAELLSRRLEITTQTTGLAEERGRQEKRDRELRYRESEVAAGAGELVRQKVRLDERERGLKREAGRLSAKEQEIEERRRREEAEQRRRHQEAEAEVLTLEAGVEAAGSEVVLRWREPDYLRVMAGVDEAKRHLRAGDLPKVDLSVERVTADLEAVEKQAFDDQRRGETRKRESGIVLAALQKVGFLRVGAKMRDAADPRSLVDIAGAMPSGKTVIFTLHLDGQMDIRQRGVSGHQECHSIEDAIAVAASGMGLAFRSARKATVRGRRPAGPAVRATARSKAPRRGV